MFKCRNFLLYFSREEKALTLAVWRWDALQLQEVEEDLHLWTHREDDQTCTRWNASTPCVSTLYLSHDLQRPAVVHWDGLGAVWDFAVLFWGAKQSGSKNGGQIVQRHLVDALIFGYPAKANAQFTVKLKQPMKGAHLLGICANNNSKALWSVQLKPSSNRKWQLKINFFCFW